MITYLWMCLVLLFSGYGLLTTRWMPVLGPIQRFSLAPLTTLSLWTLLIGTGYALGFNTHQMVPILAVTTTYLGLLGAIRIYQEKSLCSWWLPIIAFLLPLLLMIGSFRYGLMHVVINNFMPDGISYAGDSQFHWIYPQFSTKTFLNQVLQQLHASELTRYSLAQLGLGWISLVAFHEPMEPLVILPLFCAITLFTFFMSLLMWTDALKLPRLSTFGILLLTASLGWLYQVMHNNNLDQLFSLPFLPAIAGLAFLKNEGTDDKKLFAFIGYLLAAAFYTYPEMFPITALLAVLALWDRVRQKHHTFSSMVMTIAWPLILFSLLVIPGSKDIIVFFLNQLQNGTSYHQQICGPEIDVFACNKPLLQPLRYYWSSYLVVLNAAPFKTFTLNMITVMLWGWMLIGMIALARRYRGLIVWSMAVLAAYFYMIFIQHYAYGAYKILTTHLWLGSTYIVVGIRAVYADLSHRKKIMLYMVNVAVCIFLVMRLIALESTEFRKQVYKDIRPFQTLQHIKPIVGNQTVQLSVKDPFKSFMAISTLYDIHLWLTVCDWYVTTLCKTPIPNTPFILNDDTHPPKHYHLRFTNTLYTLWERNNVHHMDEHT